MDISVVIFWTAMISGAIGIGIVLVQDLLGRMFNFIGKVEITDVGDD